MDALREPKVEASLITNGVSWYLRSRLTADATALSVTTPRTVLGIVPIGSRRFEVALGDLHRIRVATRLHPERLAVTAGLVVLLALGGFGGVAVALLAVAAVAFLLLGFIAVVRIEDRSGRRQSLPVCLAHLPRARRFIAGVEELAAAAPPTARPRKPG